MSEKTNNQPTHRVAHVVGEDKQAYWTNVGVAWRTSDGEGFSFVLNFIPNRTDGRLLILPFKNQDAVNETA